MGFVLFVCLFLGGRNLYEGNSALVPSPVTLTVIAISRPLFCAFIYCFSKNPLSNYIADILLLNTIPAFHRYDEPEVQTHHDS